MLLFLLKSNMKVCLMCIQILMSNQTYHSMEISYLDINVTVILIIDTRHMCPFCIEDCFCRHTHSHQICQKSFKNQYIFPLCCSSFMHLFYSWPNISMCVCLSQLPEIATCGLAIGLKLAS